MTDGEAARGDAIDDLFKIGFRVVNPHAPVDEPRRFEPLNERAQAAAEELFEAARKLAFASDK
jgi:hypothetical protein